MDINFIENSKATGKDYSVVKEGDVVILPAFGATIQEMQMLDEKSVRTHCTLSVISPLKLPTYLPTCISSGRYRLSTQLVPGSVRSGTRWTHTPRRARPV